MGFLDAIWGNSSKREIKKFTPMLTKITSLEEEYKKLTDAQLKRKTEEFRDRLASGETMEDLLPEAFATASRSA